MAMATAAQNSLAAVAANPFGGGDHNPGSCRDDPNFATICSFLQKFGDIIRIPHTPFDDLQQWLENSAEAPPGLITLHITLLRRVFKTVSVDKWERSLAKFGHTYCSQDAWEIERFGYKKAKISTKLRLLKNLLEAQFDCNVKFKAEVNKLEAADLRLTPLGRDTEGQVYWYQVDIDANLRVYREDIDDETWEIVASTRDELESLISQLQRGEVRKPEPEAIIVPEEDSNSKDALEPKDIILDTGKVEEEDKDDSRESSTDNERQERKTVEPFIIKHDFSGHKIQFRNEAPPAKTEVSTSREAEENGDSEQSVKVSPSGIKLVFGLKSKPTEEGGTNDTMGDRTVTVTAPSEKETSSEPEKLSESIRTSESSNSGVSVGKVEQEISKVTHATSASATPITTSPSPVVTVVPKSEPEPMQVDKVDITPVPVSIPEQPLLDPINPILPSASSEKKSKFVSKLEPMEVDKEQTASAPVSAPTVDPIKPILPSAPSEKKGIDKIIRNLHASKAESMSKVGIRKKEIAKKEEKMGSTSEEKGLILDPIKELEQHVMQSTKGAVTESKRELTRELVVQKSISSKLEQESPKKLLSQGLSKKKLQPEDLTPINEPHLKDYEQTKTMLKKPATSKEVKVAQIIPEHPKSFLEQHLSTPRIPAAEVAEPCKSNVVSEPKAKKESKLVSRKEELLQKPEIDMPRPSLKTEATSDSAPVVESSKLKLEKTPESVVLEAVTIAESKEVKLTPKTTDSAESETSESRLDPNTELKNKSSPQLELENCPPGPVSDSPKTETLAPALQPNQIQTEEPPSLTLGTSSKAIKSVKPALDPDKPKPQQADEQISTSKQSLIPIKISQADDQLDTQIKVKMCEELKKPSDEALPEVSQIPMAVSASGTVEPMEVDELVIDESITNMEQVSEQKVESSTLTTLEAEKNAKPEPISIPSIHSPLPRDEKQEPNSVVAKTESVISESEILNPLPTSISHDTTTETKQKDSGEKVPSPTSVTEEPISKTTTWVCGKETDDHSEVVEEPITKTKAYICGVADETVISATTSDVKIEKELDNIVEPAAVQQILDPQTDSQSCVTNLDTKEKEHVSEEQPKEKLPEIETKPETSVESKVEAKPEPRKSEEKSEKDNLAESLKMKSSLVSALYSESSGDSNDSFADKEVPRNIAKTTSDNNDCNSISKPKDELDDDAASLPKVQPPMEAEGKAHENQQGKEQRSELVAADNTESKSDLNPIVLASEKEMVKSESNSISASSSEILDERESEDVSKKGEALQPNEPETEVMTVDTTNLVSHPAPLIESVQAPSAINDTELGATTGTKRKAENEIESTCKIAKIDALEEKKDINDETPIKEVETNANPIVGETIEEAVMIVTGEGTGAANEGVNETLQFNPIVGEEIEEEVMLIFGEGSGQMNQGSNENSPVPLAAADVPGSRDESMEESEGSRDAFPSRGRGGRRGRGGGRRGRPSANATGGGRRRSSQNSSTSRSATRGSREVARLGISLDSVDVNGENERPVRASRRIAQIRLKEEEERRKLEEERLAQLKAAQMRKKANQEEAKKKVVGVGNNQQKDPSVKGKKGAGRKLKEKIDPKHATEYLPSGSESDDNSEEEDDGSEEEFGGKLGKKGKRRKHKRGKNGKPLKKGGNPWATSSDDDEEEEAVEEEEEYHYEEEEEELVFKSDHEFSPESDLGEEDAAGPSRHARTAKQDKGELFEEGNCCKCGKGDHPEWILLCDKCDKGWHASCLRPQLWVIPEGEWFCPPCQHNMLIENLSKNLVEYESLLKKRENEILRKQRLAYVGISLDNVLPDKPEVPPEAEEVVADEDKSSREKKKQRRRILSDEDDDLSDNFINDRSDDGMSSRSGSQSFDSEDREPGYRRRLRTRRSKKAFNFKEYDDMINSALRVDDDEEGEYYAPEKEEEGEEEAGEGEAGEEEGNKVNGEKEDAASAVGGGKNDAYLKHLEKQAKEEDETDEELLDEKERLRRRELKKSAGGNKKARRRINDLDAYSEEEDSDDDFKASEVEDDDEEEVGEDGESEWSGDKMDEDSDDSIAQRAARRKDRHGGGGRRLGRREKYSDKGLVRRSTRKRKSRISYDESDEDEDEEDQNDKWQSNESEEEEETEASSESDDSTWGRKKKKPGFGGGSKAKTLANFVLGGSAGNSSTGNKGKGGGKRKKRKTDEDDVDRAWNSARGKKDKDEPIERRTRGRKIDFKVILDSGESDDDGNVRPKRRPLSDSDDSRSPSSSRKLAEEIRAENARKEKEYEASKAAAAAAKEGKPPVPGTVVAKLLEDDADAASVLPMKDESILVDVPKVLPLASSAAPILSESLSVAKLAESSVIPSPRIVPSPGSVPPSGSPPVGSPLSLPPHPAIVSSPQHLPPSSSPMIIVNPTLGSSPKPLASIVPPSSSPLGIPPPAGVPLPANVPVLVPPPPSVIPPGIPPLSSSSVLPPPPLGLPKGPHSLPFPMGTSPLNLPPGGLQKPPGIPPTGMPPVPIVPTSDKKQKQSKRGSRGSKSEKLMSLPPQPTHIPPPDLELALSKSKQPQQQPPPPPVSSSPSKSSKKKEQASAAAAAAAAAAVAAASLSVPNPALLMAGGVSLPEMLGQGLGLPSSIRGSVQGSSRPPPPTTSSSGSSSSKKSSSGKGSSSRGAPNATQQTTPPPVSQNLSPSIPIDIDRVPNPALFQGNPGMRPFHPMWVRNPGPPPPGYSPSGSPVPSSLGKPPPLNSSPFPGQQGPPARPGYPSPPPLRIPNPNTSPLQAFQHFKRDGGGPLGNPLYRLPPGQPPPGGMSLSNILPPSMMSPHGGGPERFFGAPAGYPHPYGLLPPHTQGQHPQSLFHYDYRPPEPPFKEEAGPPRTSSSSMPTPVSSSSSSPPPPPVTSAAAPPSSKEEGSAARDSEFGGLVSYFSSQRSEEDMDT